MASLSEKVIVFSGFRNDALKAAIAAKGGRVVSALSGLTTILVVKPNSRTNSKVEKAALRDMQIIELDAFCEQYGFDLDCLDCLDCPDAPKPKQSKPKPTKPKTAAAVKPGSAPTKKAKKAEPEPVPEPAKKPKAKKATKKSDLEKPAEPEPVPEPEKKATKKAALEKPVKKASKKA